MFLENQIVDTIVHHAFVCQIPQTHFVTKNLRLRKSTFCIQNRQKKKKLKPNASLSIQAKSIVEIFFCGRKSFLNTLMMGYGRVQHISLIIMTKKADRQPKTRKRKRREVPPK